MKRTASTHGTSDVLICGSGLSGLAAALSATELGARVVLIEKAPTLGGTSAISGGMVWTWQTLEALQEAVPDGNPILQRVVFEAIDDGRRWLTRQGVDLGPEVVVQRHGRGQQMAPIEAISALADRFRAAGGTILDNTALDELVVDRSGIVGVYASRGHETVELFAGAVVLATGGFQGNPELLNRYVIPNPDNLYLRANPWSTGDAFLAATKIGAASSPALNAFYGHAMIAPPVRFDAHHFAEVSQYYGQSSVALNLQGLRFTDESEGTGEEVLNQRLAQQEGGRGYYVVDEMIADLSYTPERLNRVIIDRAKRYGAPIVTAHTVEELARGLAEHGLPSGNVVRTITLFNEAIRLSNVEDLVPRRRGRHFP